MAAERTGAGEEPEGIEGAGAGGPAPVEVAVEPHPLLAAAVLEAALPRPLGELPSPPWLQALLRLDADAPVQAPPEARALVRALLRHGGFKPAGRNKPASEYLAAAAAAGRLGSINAAVDVCNAVSLHSGLPISVVDLDRARLPLRIAIAPPMAAYVFNPSGQSIELTGLLCLHDADGPCGNAVKDAQRTKTDDTTRRTLSVLWGPAELRACTVAAARWYAALLERLGAAARLRTHPA